MTPEIVREFEKTGKAIARMTGREVLFEEDLSGRELYAFWALEGNEAALGQVVSEIEAMPEGRKNLVRALNNLTKISHKGAVCFAKVIFEALSLSVDEPVLAQKLIQVLDHVSLDLRDGMGWISAQCARYLDGGTLAREMRVELWTHWCMAMLRSCNEASEFIENLAARRPKDLQRATVISLRNKVLDVSVAWDAQSAAVYLLVGNRLMGVDEAQEFVENGYACFPLEALAGVEILMMAVENDASQLAQDDAVQKKLSQMRADDLSLKAISMPSFVEASKRLFVSQKALARTAFEMAMSLPDQDRDLRIVAACLLDDVRLAQWFKMAGKSRAVLEELGGAFFENFDAENPLMRHFGAQFSSFLIDCGNWNARLNEAWQEALETGDGEAVECARLEWIRALRESEL